MQSASASKKIGVSLLHLPDSAPLLAWSFSWLTADIFVTLLETWPRGPPENFAKNENKVYSAAAVTRRLASSDNENNNENDPTKTNPTNNDGNLKQPKHEGQQNRTSAIKSAVIEARHCACFSCNVLKHLAKKMMKRTRTL